MARVKAFLSVGQVVISKRGKDAGKIYVVVGGTGGAAMTTGGMVLLADAKKFNVKNPKRKNPKHLQPTRLIIDEARKLAEEGRDIDHGRFVHLVFAAESCEINRNGEAG